MDSVTREKIKLVLPTQNGKLDQERNIKEKTC